MRTRAGVARKGTLSHSLRANPGVPQGICSIRPAIAMEIRGKSLSRPAPAPLPDRRPFTKLQVSAPSGSVRPQPSRRLPEFSTELVDNRDGPSRGTPSDPTRARPPFDRRRRVDNSGAPPIRYPERIARTDGRCAARKRRRPRRRLVDIESLWPTAGEPGERAAHPTGRPLPPTARNIEGVLFCESIVCKCNSDLHSPA
jgi:hypothetical protein